MAAEAYRTFTWRSRDGLLLSGREYGARDLPGVPAVCLAGLTRNAADFDALAHHLSGHARSPRRVVALDMRGRGASEHDPNPSNYDIAAETNDALDGMVAAGIDEAAIVGTSRGAILAMAMSAIRPGVLHAVVMNDLGPVIEPDGLVAIRAYLERMPVPKDWSSAVEAVRVAQRKSFPKLDDAGWERFARAIFTERDGRLAPAHDPAIRRTLDAVAEGSAPPPMWAAFDGLRNVPVLSVRGGLSKLFSARTQDAMAERRPDMRVLVVPDQGHAPLLDDEPTMEAVADFLAEHDR